jgi:hypothetical protein
MCNPHPLRYFDIFERHRYLRAALCTGRMFDSLHRLRMTLQATVFEILVKIAASREDPEVLNGRALFRILNRAARFAAVCEHGSRR